VRIRAAKILLSRGWTAKILLNQVRKPAQPINSQLN
jgi:hypothetical protein